MAEMKRPVPPGTDMTGDKGILPSDRNPELADAKSREYFLKHSGRLAITNNEFKAFYGIFVGLKGLGFDMSSLIETFEAYEQRTPDPQSRKDALQLFTPAKIIIPGVGAGMLGGEEKGPGLIARGWAKLTGKNAEGGQT